MYYSHTQARAKLPKKRRRVINLELPDPPARPAKMNSSLALYNKGQTEGKYFKLKQIFSQNYKILNYESLHLKPLKHFIK